MPCKIHVDEEILKNQRDWKNVIDTAREDGRKKGTEIGTEIGLKIGRNMGIIKNLKAIGFDNEFIANATELPIEEIENL